MSLQCSLYVLVDINYNNVVPLGIENKINIRLIGLLFRLIV